LSGDGESPEAQPGPDLHKPETQPGPAPAPNNAQPSASEPPEAPVSIWQPLDGSAPPQPKLEPAQQVWGRPHGQQPAAPQVAAAYSSVASLGPQGGPSGVFTLASWGRRLGAFLIDGLIFGSIGLLLIIPVGLAAGMTLEEAIRFFGMAGGAPDSVADPVPLYVALVVQRLIIGAIPAFFLARWNGQTPGKRALGVRVMRADGGAMDLRTALRRELLGRTIIVDGLTVITVGLAGLVNYLMPLWDQQRRTGHDRLADTRVVVLPPGERP
jgi:uncharacterized RDD family membrane protein YckC